MFLAFCSTNLLKSPTGNEVRVEENDERSFPKPERSIPDGDFSEFLRVALIFTETSEIT